MPLASKAPAERTGQSTKKEKIESKTVQNAESISIDCPLSNNPNKKRTTTTSHRVAAAASSHACSVCMAIKKEPVGDERVDVDKHLETWKTV